MVFTIGIIATKEAAPIGVACLLQAEFPLLDPAAAETDWQSPPYSGLCFIKKKLPFESCRIGTKAKATL